MADHGEKIGRSLIGSFIFCRSDLLPEVYARCDNAAFANFVAAISRTNSNWFEFVQLIAVTKSAPATMIFTEINRVTRGELLRRLVPATCRLVCLAQITHQNIPRRCNFRTVYGLNTVFRVCQTVLIVGLFFRPYQLYIGHDWRNAATEPISKCGLSDLA